MVNRIPLVTGAAGFVGKRLCAVLRKKGSIVRVAVRDIDKYTDWLQAVSGIGSIIHPAVTAHVIHEQSSDPVSVYCRVNNEKTVRLTTSAAMAGVRRFIFVSKPLLSVDEELANTARWFLGAAA